MALSVEANAPGLPVRFPQIEAMRAYPNFVLSTGCDLPPETPLANIQAFMEAGRRLPDGSPGGTGRPTRRRMRTRSSRRS